MAFLALSTSGCKKENNQDKINADLTQTKTQLLKSYQDAKTNDDLLKLQVSANGHFTDPGVMMEDKLYHMNDSLGSIYYLSYCKEMRDGDNMMNGNMMSGNTAGGNNMHGIGMMGTHTFMGDSATVNQCYRNFSAMRQFHTAHHPVR